MTLLNLDLLLHNLVGLCIAIVALLLLAELLVRAILKATPS
jgi:hypothetical protein